MKRTTFFNALLVAILLLAMALPVFAQSGNCQGWVVDETGTLDAGKICSAMAQWAQRGIQVIVVYSNKSFTSSNLDNDWYPFIDGLAQSNVTDQVNLLGLAMTSDTSDGRHLTVSTGDNLYYNSPVASDQSKAKILAQLSAGRASGDPTVGFINALNTAFEIAYPAIPPTSSVPPTQVIVVVIPTSVPQPTQVPIDMKPVVNAVGTVFVWLLVLAALVVVGYLVFVPGMALYRKLQHLKEVRDNVSRLLSGVARLVEGETVESTKLYTLLSAYGIQQYGKLDCEVHEWIRKSKAAVAEALKLYKYLTSEDSRKQPIEKQIRAWETLYITIVGNNREVLTLTDEQMKELLDPTANITTDLDDAQIVMQLRELRRELTGGALKVTLTVVKPTDVDREGVLGYLKKAKEQLAELREAKQKAEPTIQAAKGARGKTAGSPFPVGLTTHDALTKIDDLLLQAQTDLAGKLYLSAMRKANDVLAMIKALDAVMPQVRKAQESFAAAQQAYTGGSAVPKKDDVFHVPSSVLTQAYDAVKAADYATAGIRAADVVNYITLIVQITASLVAKLAEHEKRMQRVEAIRGKGLRMTFYQKLTAEVTGDLNSAKTELVKGDFHDAEAWVKELEADSSELLKQAEALVTLRDKNTARLTELAKQVASAESHRRDVESQWKALGAYPQSNWVDVAKFDEATATLKALFDDPSDEKDLASTIARLNGMETQDFLKAEHELDIAFTRLREAESQFTAIVERLKAVQEAERSVESVLAAVQAELDTATKRRNENDPYIDETVDEKIKAAQLKVKQAQGKIASREFFVAQKLLAEARELSRIAAAESSEQARVIMDLLANLAIARKTAEASVNAAATAQSQLTPAAQKASTAGAVNNALALLKQAKVAESAASGKEDHELADAVNEAIRLYRQAKTQADQALTRVRADKSEYDGYHSRAQSAISAASQAIANARRKVGDSDAGGAGRSSLQRAESVLPGVPQYGASLDALRRVEQAAQQAEEDARNAKRQAEDHIEEVESARRRAAAEAAAVAARAAAEEYHHSSYDGSSSTYHSSPSVHHNSPSPTFHSSPSIHHGGGGIHH